MMYNKYKNCLLFSIFLLLGFSKIFAQDKDISGKVTDANGNPLAFANILIRGSTKGTSTDFDGNFALKNVKEEDTLEVSVTGFETYTTLIGKLFSFEIKLNEDMHALDEVVVTGVAVGTSEKKLTFALSKVNKEQLKEVPGGDLGNSLRGKVAGVTIVQSSGDPNTPAAIRLRGSNSILGSQDPLIIIDGVITGTGSNLRDINMEDVESIEIIKGAAASSLYGSLSGNGVIQIITKRGKDTKGKPTLVIRGETGFSSIASKYPLATTHRFKLRDKDRYPWDLDDLDKQGRWELSKGSRVRDEDGLLDNPFPRVLDNQDKINTSQPFHTLYTALSSGNDHFKYHLSFQNTKNSGVIQGVKSSVRNNGRLNIDYIPNDKLTAKASVSYTDYKGNSAPSSTRRNGLYLEPWVNLSERDDKGNIKPRPKGYKYIIGSYYNQNPLYDVTILEKYFDRQRLMFSPEIIYKLNENLSVGVSYSHDESREEKYDYTPKEYVNPDPKKEENGEYSIVHNISKTAVAQAYTSYSKKIGDFDTRTTFKFLRELRSSNYLNASGSKLSVGGVKTLDVVDQKTRRTRSSETMQKVSNYFLDLNMSYKDKIIFNGLIRRDGSSLFGKKHRWQNFGRASLAYILTEDFEIPNVKDLKIRASWGTSGQRPGFSAQYETYSVDSRSGRLKSETLGNQYLQPSTVAEWEIGVNARLFERFPIEINYAKTHVKNDFIKAPLPKVSGFSKQWRNIGELASSALEFQLGADLIQGARNFNWDVNLSWSKIKQQITDLGGLKPFSRSRGLFRAEAGKPYGQMYGYKVVTSIDQLTLDKQGFVINGLGNPNADKKGKLKPEDFEVNENGHVVVKGTEGTEKEQAIFMSGENGEDKKMQMGNTNPDWNLGFTSNLRYKNFNLYFVLDHQQGGDIYNSTKQSMYRYERHGDQELFARQGKHISYSNNASNLDHGWSSTSHFVEDGTFTKIREVSLGFTLSEQTLKKSFLGNVFKGLKFSLIGRNVLTFTNYSGFDPEVAYVSSWGGRNPNPTNDRMDSRSYPQFRTFTGMLQLTF